MTESVVDVDGGYYPSPSPHILTLNRRRPVALAGSSQLMLRVQQTYRLVESGPPGDSWQVDVVSYNYVVFDFERREIVVYHWHPRGNSHVLTPHLHFGQGAQVGRPEVRDAHLPTGDVSLNAILRVLIEEMRVRPRRSDWQAILTE